MAKIAFIMLPEEGHLFTSFGLAEKLKSNHHKIVYVCVPAHEDLVRSNGFEAEVILENLFTDSGESTKERSAQKRPGVLESISHLRKQTRQFFEYIRSRQVDELMDDLSPDLLLVDSALPFFAMAAYRMRIRCVMISVTLVEHDYDIPPLTSAIIPDGSLRNRFLSRLSWCWVQLLGAISRNLLWVLGVETNYTRVLKKLAVQADYPVERISTLTTLMPGTGMKELILCPGEFDFPRELPENTSYIEACVREEEDDGRFPTGWIDSKRQLVFCYLGGQSANYAKHSTTLQSVINAVGSRQDWQLVFSVGSGVDIKQINYNYTNVLVVNWAPYGRLLKQAALMINHGGLGSIKQCIYHGVPMVVLPLCRDQIGNGARVVYHGLGAVQRGGNVTAKNIERMIEAVLSDDDCRQRVAVMGKRFREIERDERGLKRIERYLSMPPGDLVG